MVFQFWKIFMKNQFKIVPALDIIDGKCVRLFKGDYSKKTVYNKDPEDLAKFFLIFAFPEVLPSA